MFKSTKVFDGFSCCFRQWKAETTHCKYLHGYGVSFKVKFEGDLVYDENNSKVKILKVHKWETTNYTMTNIPYIIPAHSLKRDYPKYDTYISPYHKIQLPNGDFERVNDIRLPFIKQFKNYNGYLKTNLNDKILERITYYNFILENNSNFIANNIVVESLDKSNHLIN